MHEQWKRISGAITTPERASALEQIAHSHAGSGGAERTGNLVERLVRVDEAVLQTLGARELCQDL
ncbi:MAG: hypothetical protein E6I51_10300 [Chloroflexi bacterium]|nr:MAG: hypothetical protein E6I51_10300 [Chloroflexota bacterium]TMF22631.1 MAG: hypothetical protein E6I28_14335 [Chloroflexota bacterium]